MVHGLEIFKDYFSEFSEQYVIIGGTACDILMKHALSSFRTTKDLDIVLIFEALNDSFSKRFWKFISDGEYKNKNRSTGKECFYRFSYPGKASYPYMIELFSKKPEKNRIILDSVVTPIHISESIASLSAILLDDDYYQMILSGRSVINGITILKAEFLILLKIRAWIDLSNRISKGESIDSADLKKHKNDVFRLLTIIPPSLQCLVTQKVMYDVSGFLEMMQHDNTDLRTLNIRSITKKELLTRVKEIYCI